MPWFFCLYLLGLIWLAPPAQAQTIPPRPQPIQYVNDYAKILSPATRQALEQSLEQYFHQAQNEIVVLTLESLGDYSETELAQAIFEAWQIGIKGQDQGILVLIAMKQRRFRIHTGYGAEAFLPDVKAKALLNQYLQPAFRAQNYDQGLSDLVAALQALPMERIEPNKMPQLSANPLDLSLNLIFFLASFVLLFAYAGPKKRQVFHRRKLAATSTILILLLFSGHLWGYGFMIFLLLCFLTTQTLMDGFSYHISTLARWRTLIFGFLFVYAAWYMQPDIQELERFWRFMPYFLYSFALTYLADLHSKRIYLQRLQAAGFEHYPSHFPPLLQIGLPLLLILGAYNAQNWPKYGDFSHFIFVQLGLGFNFLEGQLSIWAFFLGSLPLIWLSQKTMSAWHETYPIFDNLAALHHKDPPPRFTLHQNCLALGILPELGFKQTKKPPLSLDFQALEKTYAKTDLETKRLEFVQELKKIPPDDLEAQTALEKSLRLFFKNPAEHLSPLAWPRLKTLHEERWPKLKQGPHFELFRHKLADDLIKIQNLKLDEPWAKTCLDYWEKILATTGSEGKTAYELWLDLGQDNFWLHLAKDFQIEPDKAQTWREASQKLLHNWDGHKLETLEQLHREFLPLALDTQRYFEYRHDFLLKHYWEDTQLLGLWSDPLYLPNARQKLQNQLAQVRQDLSQAIQTQTGCLPKGELELILKNNIKIIQELKQDPSKHLPYDETWLDQRLAVFGSDTYFAKYYTDYEASSVAQGQKWLKDMIKLARQPRQKVELLEDTIYKNKYKIFFKDKPKYTASSSSTTSSSTRSWSSSSSSNRSSSWSSSSSSSSGRSSFGGGSSGGGGASGGW